MRLEELYTRLLCVKNTNNMNCQHILTLDITKEDLEHIDACIEMRDYVNKYIKKTTNIAKYQRANSTDIDLKAMIGEYMLNTKLLSVKTNKYEVKGPAIAEILLGKTTPDFLIRDNNNFVNFDVKSNWTSSNWININENSHDRLKLFNDFYLLCLIEKENEPKFAHYIAMPNSFFDAHKIYEGTVKAPYFKIDMQKIISSSGVKV